MTALCIHLAHENHSDFIIEIGMSQSTKCDNIVSFPKLGHILTKH